MESLASMLLVALSNVVCAVCVSCDELVGCLVARLWPVACGWLAAAFHVSDERASPIGRIISRIPVQKILENEF
jgi:hypothetical protein